MWMAAITAFQQPHRLRGDARARGQSLLRELSAATKASQQIRKWWRTTGHDSLLLIIVLSIAALPTAAWYFPFYLFSFFARRAKNENKFMCGSFCARRAQKEPQKKMKYRVYRLPHDNHNMDCQGDCTDCHWSCKARARILAIDRCSTAIKGAIACFLKN